MIKVMTKQEIEKEEAFQGVLLDREQPFFIPVKNHEGQIPHYILTPLAQSRIRAHHQPGKDEANIEVITKSLKIAQLLVKISTSAPRTTYNVETKLHTVKCKIPRPAMNAIEQGIA